MFWIDLTDIFAARSYDVRLPPRTRPHSRACPFLRPRTFGHSLCKKVKGEWGRIFKSYSSSPVAGSDIKEKEELAPSHSNGEEGLPTAPTRGPVAAPPVVPRTRKASPKSAIMMCRNILAPKVSMRDAVVMF